MSKDDERWTAVNEVELANKELGEPAVHMTSKHARTNARANYPSYLKQALCLYLDRNKVYCDKNLYCKNSSLLSL